MSPQEKQFLAETIFETIGLAETQQMKKHEIDHSMTLAEKIFLANNEEFARIFTLKALDLLTEIINNPKIQEDQKERIGKAIKNLLINHEDEVKKHMMWQLAIATIQEKLEAPSVTIRPAAQQKNNPKNKPM